MTHLKAGSAMYRARMLDAIGEAAGHMQHRKGRKVLLLVSESRDRGSETSFQQAVEAVGREGSEVFGAHYSAYVTGLDAKPQDQPELPSTVVSGDPSDWPGSAPGVDFLAIFSEFGRLGKTNVVRMLTRVTGGFDYLFARERGIEDAIAILSFPQAKNEAGLHRIEVSVPHRAGLLIRSRRTYWSDRSGVQ